MLNPYRRRLLWWPPGTLGVAEERADMRYERLADIVRGPGHR